MLAIGRPTHFAFNEGIVWITGRVREEDGVDYDIGTVVYDTSNPLAPVIDSWIEKIDKRWGGSDDRAVAINVTSFGDVAYIGGWSSLSSITQFFALRYDASGASPTWKIRFRNMLGPDAGQGIISVSDTVAPFTPIFMTGKTTEASTGENQFTVRIDWP